MRLALLFLISICAQAQFFPFPGPGTIAHSGGGGGAAPTLVSYTETVWNTSTLSKTVTIPSFNAGDIIVFGGLSAGSSSGQSFQTPTATGLTFTTVINHVPASNCGAAIFTATAGSSGTSVVVTETMTNADTFGFGIWVYRSSAGVGNNASSFTSSLTTSLTPAGGAHSAIVWLVGDWAAGALQTITPAPTNTRERSIVTGQYTIYVAELADQTGTGAVSYGISGSGTGPFSIVALEIKHQ